jgi:integrase/DNA-directed RNA polymerase subunit RPC12/RpoP
MFFYERKNDMALTKCPECTHEVSDKALACPHCGYPITQRTVRKKSVRRRKKLPNGYGSIKKLSGKRRNPYAAYPPTKEFDLAGTPVTVPAIGYYPDWMKAFQALSDYNKKPYDLSSRDITFKEVYEAYFKAKYEINKKKTYSKSAISSTKVAYKNCKVLHDRPFAELRKADLQAVIDDCPLKHASLEHIASLFCQMYKYARENDIVERNYSEFVKINIADDDESGIPFTQEEINILWANKDDVGVQMILIMVYSGFRISAFKDIEINLDERYIKGGVKTAAGKNRIVPIHDSIYGFVSNFRANYPDFSPYNFRNKVFYPTLERLGISTASDGVTKHTPHDTRHTFSWLCDKYKVDGVSKHLLMGHKLSGDVETTVYAHRTYNELVEAIALIKVTECVTNLSLTEK